LTVNNAALTFAAVTVPATTTTGNLNVWIGLIEFLDQKYLSHGA
jgi:hypothetical protein